MNIRQIFFIIIFLFFPPNLFASNPLLTLENKIALSENTQIIKPKKGTEKKFFWNNSRTPRQTPLSIIYIHGFSATRGELSPVPEHIAQKLNSNLFMTRLTGHGQDGDSLGHARAVEWIKDTNDALNIGKKIGEQIIAIGFSTGAPLLIHELIKDSHPVFALILLSPNFKVKNKFSDLLLIPYLGYFLNLAFFGKIRSWTPLNENQEYYWTTRYPSQVIPEVIKLSKEVRTLPLEEIQIPTLMIYTEKDEVIDTNVALQQFNRFSSPLNKSIELKYSSDHVLAGDALFPDNNKYLETEIINYISSLIRK